VAVSDAQAHVAMRPVQALELVLALLRQVVHRQVWPLALAMSRG
jgi:hypothetical protein